MQPFDALRALPRHVASRPAPTGSPQITVSSSPLNKEFLGDLREPLTLAQALRRAVDTVRQGQTLGTGTILKVDTIALHYNLLINGNYTSAAGISAAGNSGNSGNLSNLNSASRNASSASDLKGLELPPQVHSGLASVAGVDSNGGLFHGSGGLAGSSGSSFFGNSAMGAVGLTLSGAPHWRAVTLMRGVRDGSVFRDSSNPPVEVQEGELMTENEVNGWTNKLDSTNSTAPAYLPDRVLGACGQPTVSGARAVCNLLRHTAFNETETSRDTGAKPARPLAWINTRQEPILYINNRPFVLREMEFARRNIAVYAGLSVDALERMEERLKEDVLAEARVFHGNILVHDEDLQTGDIVPCFESVSPDSVLTSREVFAGFVSATDGTLHANEVSGSATAINYHRLPLTPEGAPRPADFDAMISILSSLPEGSDIMVNCQLGRSRSSWAMCVAAIWWDAVQVKNVVQERRVREHDDGSTALVSASAQEDRQSVAASLVGKQPIQNIFRSSASMSSPMRRIGSTMAGDDLLPEEREEPKSVRALAGLFQSGRRNKRECDVIIAACAQSGGIDLRATVFQSKYEMEQARTHDASVLRSMQFATVLERYFGLLAFHQCATMWAQQVGDRPPRFAEWFAARPELGTLVADIRENPQAQFLSFDTVSALALPPGRRGAVLDQHSLLKVDLVPPAVLQRDYIDLDVSALHKVLPFSHHEEFHLYTSATAGTEQLTSFVRRLAVKYSLELESDSLAAQDRAEILWINLREEPVLMVKNQPLVLRNAVHPFQNLRTYAGIQPSDLETLENRLACDVLAESLFYDGKLLIHDETSDRAIVQQWLYLDQQMLLSNEHKEVLTLRNIFEGELAATVLAASNGTVDLTYFRIPVTAGSCAEEKDFDQFVQVWSQHEARPAGCVMFTCQKGTGRSTMAMTAYLMLCESRRHFSAPSRIRSPMSTPRPDRLLPSARGRDRLEPAHIMRKYDWRIVNDIIRILPQGQLRRLNTDRAIISCSHSSKRSLLDKLDRCRDMFEAARSADEQLACARRGKSLLERYIYLILFNAYIAETLLDGSTSPLGTFSAWISDRPELRTLMIDLSENPVEAFQSNATNLQDNRHHDEPSLVVQRRQGDVLTAGTLVKSDHFPGCQRMHLLPHIPGAPNWRRVPLEGCYVHGVAIPTMEGVSNVLAHLGVEPIAVGRSTTVVPPAAPRRAVWINLREEPVVYVNGRPFVLRQASSPFANLEHTGIDTTRVEQMEQRLKADVLADALQYDSQFLLHDEAPDGSVLLQWEEVTPQTVLTPREVYEQLQSRGYPIEYYRIAVTDEQAPEAHDFDALRAVIGSLDFEQTHLLFNCQMGRGRTTTGMVVGTLLHELRSQGEIHANGTELGDNGDKALSEAEVHQRFTRGEYMVIRRLVRVLQGGVGSKAALDRVIDKCSDMQNLRQDIMIYRDKLQEENLSDNARQAAEERGINYLRRYALLILFTSFAGVERTSAVPESFADWLATRPEFDALLQHVDLS